MIFGTNRPEKADVWVERVLEADSVAGGGELE
jgi:hypothetical protein